MTNPRLTARSAAVFFLLTLITAAFAQGYVSNRLISFSSAAVTASNIMSNQSLFQASFTVYLIEMTFQIVSAALFYVLLKPVSRNVAFAATLITLTGCIIKTFSRVFYIVPLSLLRDSHALMGFNPDQIRSLSLLLLKINDRGAGMSLAFLGLGAFLKGYLIARSTFLPRALGIVAMIGSASWLSFYYPPLGHLMFNIAMPLALLVSAIEIIWLLVFAVDEKAWRDADSECLYNRR